MFNPSQKEKRGKVQGVRRRKGRQRSYLPKNSNRPMNNGNQPTLVLKAHALITQNITGVNVKQINIIPTLSIFNARILETAASF